MEKWKVISDYSNYEVSNRGRVRSVLRLSKYRGRDRWSFGKIRKLCKTTFGYPAVALSKDGRKQLLTVHRLVLKAFRGPPPAPGMVCRHLDGDTLNNRLANLVWGTYKENSDDMKRHGTSRAVGETNPTAKLTEKQVLKIRKLYATGEYTMISIATAYGVTKVCVLLIVHRRRWTHI